MVKYTGVEELGVLLVDAMAVDLDLKLLVMQLFQLFRTILPDGLKELSLLTTCTVSGRAFRCNELNRRLRASNPR